VKKIIKKVLKEESDELDWIKDTQPPSFSYLLGKALYFDPYIDNMVDLKKILNLLVIMGFKHGDWPSNLSFEDEEDDVIGLYLNSYHASRGRIVYTGLINEDYEEHISSYADRPVEVLDGWQTLGYFLYDKRLNY
jgi:hypothetical protein